MPDRAISDDMPDDPMTTETARMFYERALKAEAEVKRLQDYLDQMPYPDEYEAEVERLREESDDAVADLRALIAEQAEVIERLRDLLREAHEDPYANLTVSLDERIRAALDIATLRQKGVR